MAHGNEIDERLPALVFLSPDKVHESLHINAHQLHVHNGIPRRQSKQIEGLCHICPPLNNVLYTAGANS